MYHYVRPDSSEYPFFRNLNVESFRKQLDYFGDKYGFLSKEDYINSISTGIEKKGVVLTFDDGLKDHHKFVLPELQRRGLWGIFYIPTGHYVNEKLLGVHRVHYLKGMYGSKYILDKISRNMTNFSINIDLINRFETSTYHHFERNTTEKKLQRLLNYYLDYPTRDKLLDTLMEELLDEKKIYEELYLTEKEVKELSIAGNIIGSHTVNHKVLSRLSYEDQFVEIKESLEFLKSIVPIDYLSFCYPYGYNSSYNKDTLKVLAAMKFDDACVFDNIGSNKTIRKYELSRIDCNQFVQI